METHSESASHSDRKTQGIRVTVHSSYVPSRSEPQEDYYFFVYQVVIENEGDVAAKVLSRHWRVEDAHGEVQSVTGPGVVGEQPLLEPGDSFRYMSACPLRTPRGSMSGTYEMLRADRVTFDAEIGRFELLSAVHLH